MYSLFALRVSAFPCRETRLAFVPFGTTALLLPAVFVQYVRNSCPALKAHLAAR